MLVAAGYHSVQTCVSWELTLQWQTPEEWAREGWETCVGMPFADLPALLGEQRVERMRRAYLAEATAAAAKRVVRSWWLGVAEPYDVMWVTATAAGAS
jgi:hypothetical protein